MSDTLKTLALGVPAHIVNQGFILSERAAFGDRFLYSNDGHGMGRQHVATLSADKRYVGSLAEYMAAAHPIAILQLIARAEAAEAGMEPAIKEAERRGYENGRRDMRADALSAAWAVVCAEPDHTTRTGACATAQAVAAVSVTGEPA